MAIQDAETDKTTAHKLHRQFGHPTPEALIQLIKNAKINNKNLLKEVRYVSENCVICLKNKKNISKASSMSTSSKKVQRDGWDGS